MTDASRWYHSYTPNKKNLNLQSFSPSDFFFLICTKLFSSMCIHLDHIHHYILNKLKNGNTEFRNEKSECGGPLDPAASAVPPFSEDTFLYVFYFFHPFLLESLLHVMLFLFLFYAAHVHQLALVNLMVSDQLFVNKLIDIYLITTNNTSENIYGHV